MTTIETQLYIATPDGLVPMPVTEQQQFLAEQAALQNAVPDAISQYAAKAYLDKIGALDSVAAAMGHSDVPRLVRIAWESQPRFRRNSEMVNAMAKRMGWTDKQVDDMFRAAHQEFDR